MRARSPSKPIGSRPVLASVVLGGAALIGFGIGTWLGRYGPGAPLPPALPSPTASSTVPGSPSVPATPSATPIATASPTATATSVTVFEMEGTGDATSEPFDASAGLRIEWKTTGKTFRIAMTGDQDLGTIVNQSGPASGSISVAVTGTFHLEVTADGPWSITVLQGGG
jgi:hypothetical protein